MTTAVKTLSHYTSLEGFTRAEQQMSIRDYLRKTPIVTESFPTFAALANTAVQSVAGSTPDSTPRLPGASPSASPSLKPISASPICDTLSLSQ
jgi:hypothetical protein